MRLVDYNTPFCKSNNTHAISSKKIFFSAISFLKVFLQCRSFQRKNQEIIKDKKYIIQYKVYKQFLQNILFFPKGNFYFPKTPLKILNSVDTTCFFISLKLSLFIQNSFGQSVENFPCVYYQMKYCNYVTCKISYLMSSYVL